VPISSFLLRRPLVLGIALLLLDTPAWAALGGQGASLKGIKAVAVVVEKMRADAERDGLTRNQLQTDVEQRLRQAGITVDNQAPGFLAIFVNTLKVESGFYVYAIRVQFKQTVRIERNSKIAVLASTWEAPSVVGTVGTRALRDVRGSVRDRVDEFINAYLEQNPRSRKPRTSLTGAS
jgi:hypothetical protein